MAHIFKHTESDKLYTIEHLKVDLRFLNGGAFTGIYAIPYKWNGKVIEHTKQDFRDGKIAEFNPEKFVADNFDIVGELW
jgi:hypothetical protein